MKLNICPQLYSTYHTEYNIFIECHYSCINPCRGACGEGAYCDVRNGRAICSCPEHYQGNPDNRCVYSFHHWFFSQLWVLWLLCSYWIYVSSLCRCYAECTAHDDCPRHQACFQLKCIDPCVGACGSGADCKVEDHKPICSCPKDHTGHPFESCRPFTKGKGVKGEKERGWNGSGWS